jgi:hypothetical protein
MIATETLIGGSLDPVAGRTVEELETDCRIWEQNARGVLAKLKGEQAKNRNLMKLIWAIVLKHGGETRLSGFERGIDRDDWELLEYTDMETLDLVIKARSAPNAGTQRGRDEYAPPATATQSRPSLK